MERIDRADAYALLTDGRCVRLRSVTPQDWQSVYDFAETLGPDSLYRRFFGVPSHPGETLAELLCAPVPEGRPAPHGGLLALLEGRPVGLAEWYRVRESGEAEIAFAVSDTLHRQGIATLLAEHLMSAVESAGIRRLVAITQGGNRDMLGVFLALGVPVERAWEGGECTLTIDLGLGSAARAALLDAVAGRERVADAASLRSLFAPESLAVFGDEKDAQARQLFDGLIDFTGPVHRGGPDGALLPNDARPELAVITSPPQDAVAAARRCAEHAVKTLVVTSTGFTREQGRELLRICHKAGMRLVGPGSLGVAAPHGAGGFSALLSARPPRAGRAGVAVQSGGVGLALLSHLQRLGIGVSTFVAVGEKYDVSANDLLLHWEQDSDTRFGLLHVESFGNPRKFARTARRLSHRIPLLAVDPEQSPSEARTALYAQAGIVTVPSLGALVNAAALADTQSLPHGRRVAVVGNTHGMVSLAVQACLRADLEVVQVVNATPAADNELLRRVVARIAADGPEGRRADAVLLALAPAAPANPDPAVAAAGIPEHVVALAVKADQPETVTVRETGETSPRRLPCYNDPAAAADALAALARAQEVTQRAHQIAPPPQGLDLAAASSMIESLLKGAPAGRELTSSESESLLSVVGVDVGEKPSGGRTVVFTAWQDPVFGPLLTAAADEGRERATVLAPPDAQELAALTGRVAGRDERGLEDLAGRLAALVEQCPQLASIQVAAVSAESVAGVATVAAAIAPAQNENPYLRRLRRAPVD